MSDDDGDTAGSAPQPSAVRARRPYLIVGVGASAGGLESLERLFAQVPDATGLGFVVVQHLSPHHPTMMVELLARCTDLDVRTALHGATVRRDTIHVLPPGKRVAIRDGRLLLEEQPTDRLNLPIDGFFSSLAADTGPAAVGIVLSGTGADGTRGIADIRAGGGLVLAETALTAQFSGMPDSAVASGHVHRSLAPEEMMETLAEHLADRAGTPPVAVDVGTVLELLHERHGLDFSQYKQPTVVRRIERRVQLADGASGGGFEAYLEMLRNDPVELDALYHDMLIGVTRFFRDIGCFERIEFEVLPRLLADLAPGEPLRVWSAGCASGEEAYSLAILAQEAVEATGHEREIKIFATDLHRGAIARAAEGVYRSEQLENVCAGRLARHFDTCPGGHRVSDRVRRHVVFAPHDLLSDAPFTRLDLVVCRNLLIYFEVPAQARALRLLHFGLKLDGVLVLGPSEALGPIERDYAVMDDKCRVYRKTGKAALARGVHFEAPSRSASPRPLVDRRRVGGDGGDGGGGVSAELLAAYDALLDRHMPPSVLLDGRDRIVDSYAGAARILSHPARRPDADFFNALDTDVRGTLRDAVERARIDGERLRLPGVALRDGGGRFLVRDLEIAPVGESGPVPRFVLVTFRGGGVGDLRLDSAGPGRMPDAGLPPNDDAFPDAGPVPSESSPPARSPTRSPDGRAGVDAAGTVADDSPATPSTQARALAEQVSALQQRLQQTVEMSDTVAEELQATNEELVTSNEELQSSNEELNSINEELHSVNAEYQTKIVELRELNEDMNHLLASTDIGTVFLDRELRVRRYTRGIDRAYDLRPADVGRSIESFACRIDLPDLDERMREVIASGVPHEREVRDRRGLALLLRLLPYELSGQIAGLVMTLIDISLLDDARAALADSEAKLRRRVAELQTVYANVPVGLCFFDRNLRYVRANERMAQIDGVAMSDYGGRRIADVLPGALAARIEPILQRVLDTGRPVTGAVLDVRTGAHPGETREYLVTYHPAFDPGSSPGEGPAGVSCVIAEVPVDAREREPDAGDGAGAEG